jgi:bifunctional DNA-binding transcriptional regulator/antitoxin component of YhaV-PrlF toxin-antitoxin module
MRHSAKRPYNAPLIAMNASGRITLPVAARRELDLEHEAQFAVEVVAEGLLLRPVVVLPREDAWAYTPEHRRLLRKAHTDSHEGRVRQLTESELGALASD